MYVAFVIDCFSRPIVGWHAATVKDTAIATTALKMALWPTGPRQTCRSRRVHPSQRCGQSVHIKLPSRKPLP
ncbi:hypothetical protein ACFVX3_18220 [Rhodococcus erythropolis]